MSEALELRSGYFSDRPSFFALRDLLEDTFGIDIGLLDRLHGPNPEAMPFGYFDAGGRCVANFTAFAMPMMVDGEVRHAVGYQSGAVRPEFRGRGLYRELLRRAFAWSEAQQFDFGMLLTDKAGLYEPYGFAVRPQHAFDGPAPATLASDDGARRLSLDSPADVLLLTELLARREPVSRIFGFFDQSREFVLNASFDAEVRLSYLPGCESIIAWRNDEDRFELLDVVAPRIPALAEITSALGVVATDIRVCFPTDRLKWRLGTPVAYEHSCQLLVRPMAGSGPSAGFLMVSPISEF